ncbi:uncharacterized protein K452DRAFT_280666 [Aplosporella prunicola CBS 121167]|uniref:Sulfatase-modifying factor enzyme domain-containing protein n=1 Tax=Aplosporella prunicola CBS 121167 TaxID=1176127 RepID=A0A6A6AVN7_9PEZI|nr:uncharacterized protein K452DRAFT_280666 [Aplosporella prunicola CBS 121167]KAF2136009.1 hypothetical protein K452DRAFT_280666 [Aplosporella prunicola CBS 121167]
MTPPKNPYAFPLKPKEYAPGPVPILDEWKALWNAWDLVTTKMIPVEALMEKPIPLRNPLLFYLGHIPTFEDIHLTRATGKKPTEPACYATMFERGIDPDVNDPTQCHDHSELPEVWPLLSEIINYRERVKARIMSLYITGEAFNNRCIGRALWIGFEHEALHIETFLYMSILSPNQLPPPDIPRPNFAGMAREAAAERVENEWFRIPEQEFTIGYEDPESDDGPNRFFAWDNERKPYNAQVESFEAQARPVSVGEFAAYLVDTGIEQIPVTWVDSDNSNHTDGNHSFISRHGIRTVWGPLPLSQALDWPATASYNEVAGYAKWVGARIPTLHEVRSIHEYVERTRKAPDSAVNKTFHTDSEAVFVDLGNANVGFQNFHPTPVTQNGSRLCGLGEFGGAWEWTSDSFAPQPGFKPMDIYPGYSADFLDGKHIAIVGGSWAVHPRIAGRKSFLNWWQRNYLYPWVATRLVRDI